MPETDDRMLYGRRRRSEEIARREAEGQNLWTTEFDSRTRVRLKYITEANVANEVAAYASQLLREEEGFDAAPSLLAFKLGAASIGLDDRLSIIEAIYYSLAELDMREAAEAFAQEINQTFLEHRISFELIEGRVVPFESREMHKKVVAPALTLLARNEWTDVERDYQQALTEIGRDPSDAITDAGRALEATLDRLGCDGRSLGPKIEAARRRGLLGPHDSKLTDGIEKIMEWVSADRSQRGDTHTGGTPNAEDAWLTVHIVGALILRLASSS